MARAQAIRKQHGAWYTPSGLVELMVGRVLADLDASGWFDGRPPGRPILVVDPACGDGRFLAALRTELHLRGHTVEMTGCDVDADALAEIVHPNVRKLHVDALAHDWGDERYDIVIGNPPFLSQMAATTSRGGSSAHGGGPYADAAAEFLALAVRLAEPDGGAIALVLPQSILASRDAGPVRELVDGLADHAWSYWEAEQRHFDASVNVCILGFRRPSTGATPPLAWTSVVTDRLGIPPLDLAALAVDGTLADRAELNANFRDEYYALVPAVRDDADGPPLVTSGLIDPGACRWGERPVRFAKQNFAHPRVDLDRLEGRFPAWAARKLVPKVLVANQTKVVEAVADPGGDWLPGVPVTTVVPIDPTTVFELEAVLNSPVASAICWHLGAGTGLSTTSVRVGPGVLGRVPWPSGDLTAAIAAMRRGNATACGVAIMDAFGVVASEADALLNWWAERLPA